MVFSSLCFYEKQVTDNNWFDTLTYFPVNFALVFYYTYAVGMKFFSQNCVMDLSTSVLFFRLNSCALVWDQRWVPPTQHRLILNCPQRTQLLASLPDFTCSYFFYVFSCCRSPYNTSLLKQNTAETEHDDYPGSLWPLEVQRAGDEQTKAILSLLIGSPLPVSEKGGSCIFQL